MKNVGCVLGALARGFFSGDTVRDLEQLSVLSRGAGRMRLLRCGERLSIAPPLLDARRRAGSAALTGMNLIFRPRRSYYFSRHFRLIIHNVTSLLQPAFDVAVFVFFNG